MELSQSKHQGRRRPIPIEGKTVSRMADHVITAIGQTADAQALSAMSKKAGRGMRIKIDAGTGATADPFWFAGGDVVTGPASFVEALEAGKVAAYGIDQKLSGKAAKVPTEAPGDAAAMLKEKRYAPKNVAKRERVAPKKLSPKKRAKNFAEVEATYTADQAQKEAARCLTCGTCGACNNCIDNFGCPAFYKEGGEIFINPTLCDGCGTCVQICPNGAIELIGGTGRGPAQ
jgi:ferredoxin